MTTIKDEKNHGRYGNKYEYFNFFQNKPDIQMRGETRKSFTLYTFSTNLKCHVNYSILSEYFKIEINKFECELYDLRMIKKRDNY